MERMICSGKAQAIADIKEDLKLSGKVFLTFDKNKTKRIGKLISEWNKERKKVNPGK